MEGRYESTNAAIVARLNQEVIRALKAPDVIERLAKQGGNEIVGNTPEQFAKVIEAHLARYAKLIREARIKPE